MGQKQRLCGNCKHLKTLHAYIKGFRTRCCAGYGDCPCTKFVEESKARSKLITNEYNIISLAGEGSFMIGQMRWIVDTMGLTLINSPRIRFTRWFVRRDVYGLPTFVEDYKDALRFPKQETLKGALNKMGIFVSSEYPTLFELLRVSEM